MNVSFKTGKTADASIVVNIPKLVTANYEERPDPNVPYQRMAFATSGHRGSAFDRAFTEWHILAITQANCQYRKQHRIGASPAAYETSFRDAMKNAATLFMRADQVEAAWRLWMPVLGVWTTTPAGDFPNYAAGAWGPDATQHLPTQQGYSWPLPMKLVGNRNTIGEHS
jgi:glucose-6-phosphate 1-dehydrogenase